MSQYVKQHWDKKSHFGHLQLLLVYKLVELLCQIADHCPILDNLLLYTCITYTIIWLVVTAGAKYHGM